MITKRSLRKGLHSRTEWVIIRDDRLSFISGDDNMPYKILRLADIQRIVKPIADKYHIDEVYVFGSYARNEATPESDIDFLVFGSQNFKPTSIFAFAEELRMAIQKNIDVFEIREVNQNSAFYNTIINERVRVA